MAFDVVTETYKCARPDLDPAAVEEVIRGAVERAREKHNDFDRFRPAIEFLATVFFTDHRKMPIDDYLETLYCAVKHGDYSKPWRAELRNMKPEASDAAAPPAPPVQ